MTKKIIPMVVATIGLSRRFSWSSQPAARSAASKLSWLSA